jgi:phosphoribosylformimino-5-aminoimidazole carboxamide ribotide isomerase
MPTRPGEYARVIPVLDIRDGQAVHAVGGQRAHYQPLKSVVHAGCDPKSLARALSVELRPPALYVADLDAIAGAGPDLGLVRALVDLGTPLWLDAGIGDGERVETLVAAGVETVVLGLETIPGASFACEAVRSHGAARLALSLDLRAGRPLTRAGSDWSSAEALAIAGQAVEAGIRRLILLDLAIVGTGRGVTHHLPLVEGIRREAPGVELVVGGGVSGLDDLRVLAAAGVGAALVGSALHDGRIDLASLRGS